MLIISRTKPLVFLFIILLIFLSVALFYAPFTQASSDKFGMGAYGEGGYGTTTGLAESCTAQGDEDGNGECDYDSTTCSHGDSACPVEVTALSVSNTAPTAGSTITAKCTSTLPVNSLNLTVEGVGECSWDSWTGNTATFNCNVGSATGTKTVRCSVDTAKSYKTGTDKTATINVQLEGGGGGGGGGGEGGEGGVGGGEGTRYTPPGLELSQNLINVKLKQGESKTIDLKVKNPSTTTQTVAIDLKELEKFVLASEASFELGPHEEKTLTLKVTVSDAEPPEVYTGMILIKSEDIQKIVKMIITVIEKNALLDVKVQVPKEYKSVMVGQEVEADIIVHDLYDSTPIDVLLSYGVKDFDGNIFNLTYETLTVKEQTSIKKRIKVPEDFKPGSYIFYVSTEYKGHKTANGDVFEVKEKGYSWVKIKEKIKEKTKQITIPLGILVIILCAYAFLRKKRFLTKETQQETRENAYRQKITEKPKPEIKRDITLLRMFINQARKKGYTNDQIIKDAERVGWTKKEVLEAFKGAEEQTENA